MNINKKVTIIDVAQAVGVSMTTVHKAITGKPRISEYTKRIILEKVEELGFKTNRVAQSLTRKTIRIGIIIERYFSGFNDEIIKGMNDEFTELSDFKVEPVYNNFENSYDIKKVLNDFSEIVKTGVDGVILLPSIGSEYIEILKDLDKKNIPLILVANDILENKKLSVIKQNTKVVGAIAAELLGFFNPSGNNVILIGDNENISHKEVIEGFMQYMTSSSTLINIYETHDNEKMACYITEKILNEYPFVNGIFINTAYAYTVCSKIIDAGMSNKIKIICTDVYPQVIHYLKNDVIQAVIFQEQYKQGKIAVTKMYRYIAESLLPEQKILIYPKIVIKSNYQEYL